MTSFAQEEAVSTITTHYIYGAFVESHGHEIMDNGRFAIHSDG